MRLTFTRAQLDAAAAAPPGAHWHHALVETLPRDLHDDDGDEDDPDDDDDDDDADEDDDDDDRE